MVGGQNVSHPGPGNEDTVFEMRGGDFLSALFLLRRGAAITNLYGFHPRKKKNLAPTVVVTGHTVAPQI